MKTYMAKGETVEHRWYVVDATDMVLGRLSSQVAAILRGKNKPIYTPHVDTGDHVIIINADKVRLTGKKLEDKTYKYHTGYPGGLKEITYGDLLAKKPCFAVYESIRRMMPKGPLGRQMLKKLRVYAGPDHKHEAQQPEVLVLK
ncbi:MAG: 50S ribosomal protein L13 [Eubacteriales bacterium]|jgi:large subunit ribosomal protein L13|nr:50S ribosomal protein L13 [Clostridiales bacterium]MDD7395974.1 50S ribosomal protein L13 [Eubacteriales bacterium]MDY2982749.1 50S ribosomal protein L13 [Eubacteriales bacterium]